MHCVLWRLVRRGGPLFDAVRRAALQVRSGGGTHMIELNYFRRKGHAQHDPQDYVDPALIRAWEKKDPLDLYRSRLLKNEWASEEELMYVVGATKAEYLKEIRKWVPNHYLLVPGVGAQGGTVSEVMEHGKANSGAGLLINSSRGIIYASQAEDFAQAAGREAAKLQAEMAAFL